MTTSMPMQNFYADRGFMLLIRHKGTGIELFTAWIDDPTAD